MPGHNVGRGMESLGKSRKSQIQNKKGTKYGGKLAGAMAKKNAPKKETALNKSLRRRIEAGINVVSPEDAAAVLGRYVGSDDAKERFGSKNKAAEAYSGLVQQQQQRLQDRFPEGPRQRVGDKVAPAGENFALRTFNEAAGFNPTRGMGILDSLRSNYEQSGAKFNRNQAIRGIIGTLLGGPLGGIALGNLPVEAEKRPEGINEFGMPIFDGRQIDEFQTEPTFTPETVIDTPETVIDTPITPMRRPDQRRDVFAVSDTFSDRTGLPTDFVGMDIADPGMSNIVFGPDGKRYFGTLNRDTGQMEYKEGADPVSMGPAPEPFVAGNVGQTAANTPFGMSFRDMLMGIPSLFRPDQNFVPGSNLR